MRNLGPIAILSAVLVLVSMPATADCAGPTFEHDSGEHAPGSTITVVGVGFGDNCYDTGPPPPGEGILGRPIADITIAIAQDGRETDVATGSADASYEFSVDVVLPPDLAPGSAEVRVRWGAGFDAFLTSDGDLTVTDDPPVAGDHEVRTFGPDSTGFPEVEGAEPPAGGSGASAWLPLGGLILVAAGLAIVIGRTTRRSRRNR